MKYLWLVFSFERQVSLGNDSYASALAVNDESAANLVLLHRFFATFKVIFGAAGDWVSRDETRDRGCFGIETLGKNAATKITIGNDAFELLRLTRDYGDRTDVFVSQNPGNIPHAVSRPTAYRILSHYVFHLHKSNLQGL
ncbi:MAG TPA: hypothetical protein VI488_11430 [Candidatus Angelobacter sp.]